MLCLHRRATPDPSSVLFCPVLLACPAPHPTPWGSPRFKERLQLGYRLLREHNDVTGAATLLFDIAPASNAKDWVSSLAVRQAGAPAASAVLKQHSDITGHAPHMRQVCVTRISAAAATPPSQPSSTLACRNHPCPPPLLCCPHHQVTRIQLACAAYKHAWYSRDDQQPLQPLSVHEGGLRLQDVRWMRAQWLLARTLCEALLKVCWCWWSPPSCCCQATFSSLLLPTAQQHCATCGSSCHAAAPACSGCQHTAASPAQHTASFLPSFVDSTHRTGTGAAP